MIDYRPSQGALGFFKQLCHRAGSVFPSAFKIALPCALLTAALNAYVAYGEYEVPFLEDEDSVLRDNAAWGGFSFLVGFLIVFRTSQSYNRFWDGCTSTHHMRAEWFDGCSSLLAFCKHSKAEPELINKFQNTLVRLFSMLHAAALAEIEDCASDQVDDYEAFNFALIDAAGIDETSLLVIKASHAKVELIFQWIQQLVVENINTGVLSIPPPILSRSFQEIANGMVAFHDAMKISYIPFPFPYAQTCDFLLMIHWIIVPFVTCDFVMEPYWAAVFSFIQVFILWALNFIAVELENPFGSDANDIDGGHMQAEMNQHLILLMSPSTKVTPTLSSKYKDLSGSQFWDKQEHKDPMRHFAEQSFSDVWNDLAFSVHDDSMKARMSHKPVARRSHHADLRTTSHNPHRGVRTRFSNMSRQGSTNSLHDLEGRSSDATTGSTQETSHEVVASQQSSLASVGISYDPIQHDMSPIVEIDDTPDEPKPLQVQNVQVLETGIPSTMKNAGTFYQEGALLSEDTFGSDRPTTAPHSIQGVREDTLNSSRNGELSYLPNSSSSTRCAPRKAGGEFAPLVLEQQHPIGRASGGRVSYSLATEDSFAGARVDAVSTTWTDGPSARARDSANAALGTAS